MTPIEKFQADGAQAWLVDYPLNAESIVFDVGGYCGEWTKQLLNCDRAVCPTCGCKRDPKIYIFEPIVDFAGTCIERFRNNHRVEVVVAALGNREEGILIYRDGPATTAIKAEDNGTPTEANLIPIHTFCYNHGIEKIDLISINIEGGEYELLRVMVETGVAAICKNIQVQFHDNVRGASGQRDKIRRELEKTHECRWNYDFVWESWRRK